MRAMTCSASVILRSITLSLSASWMSAGAAASGAGVFPRAGGAGKAEPCAFIITIMPIWPLTGSATGILNVVDVESGGRAYSRESRGYESKDRFHTRDLLLRAFNFPRVISHRRRQCFVQQREEGDACGVGAERAIA